MADRFLSDDGSVPDALVEVMAGWQERRLGLDEVVPVLAKSRLLLPLLEVDSRAFEADSEAGAEHSAAQCSADRPHGATVGEPGICAGGDRAVAVISLHRDAGAQWLAFTGVSALAQWHAQARPMPVLASRVAAAALAEASVGLLINPASADRLTLSGEGLHRLATSQEWPRPWADSTVARAVSHELARPLAEGMRVRLRPPSADADAGRPVASMRVDLAFPEVLDRTDARRRAQVVAEALAGSGWLRQVFSGDLEMSLSSPVR